jgi:hypothetical protein
MPQFRPLGSRKIAVVFAVTAIVLLVVLVSVGRTLRKRGGLQSPKDPLIARVEKSPMTPIRIQQDDDAPLRIIEAKVHEVSAADYERITGEKSDLTSVISAPEVKVINTSNKTVKRILLVVDDPSAEKSQGINKGGLAIAPGDTFTIVPANFVKVEYTTSVDENGKLASGVREPMRSKKFWLPFPDRTRLQVRVGVEFDDGTRWYNRDQRGGSR